MCVSVCALVLRFTYTSTPSLSHTPIQVTSANAQLKEGDIVTVRGKGRLEIAAVEKTSKDKYRVKMTKFA